MAGTCLMTFAKARRFAQTPSKDKRWFIRLAEWTIEAETLNGKKRAWISYDHKVWWIHFNDGTQARVIMPADITAAELGRSTWTTCTEACLLADLSLQPARAGEVDDPNFDLGNGDCAAPERPVSDDAGEDAPRYVIPGESAPPDGGAADPTPAGGDTPASDGITTGITVNTESTGSSGGGGGGGGGGGSGGGSGGGAGTGAVGGGGGTGGAGAGAGSGGGQGGGGAGGGGGPLNPDDPLDRGDPSANYTLWVEYGPLIQTLLIGDTGHLHIQEIYARVTSSDTTDRDLVNASLTVANFRWSGTLKVNAPQRQLGTLEMLVAADASDEYPLVFSVFGAGKRNRTYKDTYSTEFVPA